MVNLTAACHNQNDSMFHPRGQVRTANAAIRGEALLEEKKKGNVPYRVPGLVAVLWRINGLYYRLLMSQLN